jgi:hypothetical protein
VLVLVLILVLVSECCLNNCVLLISNIFIEAVGEGLPSDTLNAIISLVKPYIEGDILRFIEEKMKSTLEEVLVDFDIREVIDV